MIAYTVNSYRPITAVGMTKNNIFNTMFDENLMELFRSQISVKRFKTLMRHDETTVRNEVHGNYKVIRV